MALRKRKTAERLTFVEPELSAENEVRFQYGIDLFNTGHYWDAHESWEEIWQELGDEPEDDWEILLRGLIQIAAGLHCLFLKKERGSRGNLKKGWSKIALREDHFLGLDLKSLAREVERCLDCPDRMTGYIIKRELTNETV